MSPAPEHVLVAQVILRSGSGEEITGQSIITSESLHRFKPDPVDAGLVVRAFADAGFEVGPVLGIGMSLTGSRKLFERYFSVSLQKGRNEEWVVLEPGGHVTRELPSAALPTEVSARTHLVTFEPPTDPMEESPMV